jgi:glycosyltransferase involved in cell wall biosynthesis
VYSGIDPHDFAPGSRSDSSWSWRLLSVGRIDPRKGVDVAIRALARCPSDASLSVVGRGDDRVVAELRALAGELGVAARVTFGHADRSELGSVYRAADALVFSPTWDEPFGLVPLEAMACGLPVVASPTGGAREFLLDDDNCVTFPPGDDETLGRALVRMAEDPALRRRLVQRGRATAADFGVDGLADRLEAWHRAAVDPSAPRPAETPPRAVRPPLAGRP